MCIKNMALDFVFCNKVRSFKDGITFFDFETNLDLYEVDHNPKFEIRLTILNVIIFELTIYNILHKEDKK